eukprot:scaffold3894_cov71-Skeletonema_marinoi.AAC.5
MTLNRSKCTMNTCRCEADERYRFEGERESSQTIKSPQEFAMCSKRKVLSHYRSRLSLAQRWLVGGGVVWDR